MQGLWAPECTWDNYEKNPLIEMSGLEFMNNRPLETSCNLNGQS